MIAFSQHYILVDMVSVAQLVEPRIVIPVVVGPAFIY